MEEDEHYIVNWHTSETGAVAGQTYRVRVVVSGVVLGQADVAVATVDADGLATGEDEGAATITAPSEMFSPQGTTLRLSMSTV